MTKRTTLQRLRSWWMRTANDQELSEERLSKYEPIIWRRSHLPLPTLPDKDYLTGPYITEIRKSAPNLEVRATRYINHYLKLTGEEQRITSDKERGR